jgi:hypothetical protein
VALAGLGWLENMEGTEAVRSQDNEWTWTRSDFGATFLVKRRLTLRELPECNWPVRRELPTARRARRARQGELPVGLVVGEDTAMTSAATQQPLSATTADWENSQNGGTDQLLADYGPVNIDQMLEWVAGQRYSNRALGYATRRIAERGTAEQLVAFTAAVRAAIRDPYRQPR